MPLAPPAPARAPLGLRYALLRLRPSERGWTSVGTVWPDAMTATALATHLRPAIDQLHVALHRYLGDDVPAALTAPLALDDAVRARLAVDRPVLDWLAHQNLEHLNADQLVHRLHDSTAAVLARSLGPHDDVTWHPDLARSAPRFAAAGDHPASQPLPSVLDGVSRLLHLRALDAIGDHLDALFAALEPHWLAATQVVRDALAVGITRTTTSNDVVLRMGDAAAAAWRALNSGPDAVRNVEQLWQLRIALVYAAGCYVDDGDLFDPDDQHTHPGSDLPAHRTRWLSRLAGGHVPLSPAALEPAAERRHMTGPRGAKNPADQGRHYLDPDDVHAAVTAAKRNYPDTTPTTGPVIEPGGSYPDATQHTSEEDARYRRLFGPAPAVEPAPSDEPPARPSAPRAPRRQPARSIRAQHDEETNE